MGSTRLRADLRRSGKLAEALRREEPSHTYRLRFHASRADDLAPPPHGVAVRMLKKSSDADAMNRVFATERLTEPE